MNDLAKDGKIIINEIIINEKRRIFTCQPEVSAPT